MITILDPTILRFPSVGKTHPSGILAIGGALTSDWLIHAYQRGVFPWFEDGEPITWWAPDPRMVVIPSAFKPSKSMRNILNRGMFQVTFNTNFRAVIQHCQRVKRQGQNGTWITDDMLEAYCELHQKGWAKSVEVWQNGSLVGGLYGIDLGRVFCGESMFSLVSNASKVAFHHLIQKLKEESYYLLDCQVYNPHLALLGAKEMPRTEYMDYLNKK
ncbi:leucyl/phenylalanyl-tRNA--protein transferase [Myroides sp. DF42-4-2]|uniref:leucyl/phenylalanyl-tRNA--protein transferase n=1 Tax=unclassified Myroides TaxID=2642485 RepID=UPI0025761BE9|nr:leucyl/phenylalanyl-tRNA--protein transferase [Myroides sp. DF42-4-2]MDM1407162.1 leucyl/phenylalanyl-tRNA--protein transferase [Myroides sp. DF42-4-2]